MSIAYPPNMTDDQLFEFCQIHQDLRIERTADAELIIMPAAGGETGNRNAILTASLTVWALQDDTGEVFDSSTGFYLPNGAMRSPDGSWVNRSKLTQLTAEQKEKFLPICPEFVVELMSPSDNLATVCDKMQEYIDNGAQLGWLLDPRGQTAHIYRPNQPVEILDSPSQLYGDPVLPGFVLNLERIWNTRF